MFQPYSSSENEYSTDIFFFLFQVNIKYIKDFEQSGMQFVGRDVDGERMEIMEIKGMIDALVR